MSVCVLSSSTASLRFALHYFLEQNKHPMYLLLCCLAKGWSASGRATCDIYRVTTHDADSFIGYSTVRTYIQPPPEICGRVYLVIYV